MAWADAYGADVSDQAHGGGFGRAVEVGYILRVRARQGHDLLGSIGLPERLDEGESAIAGRIDPHAEVDALALHQADQPGAGRASIKQHQVARAHAMQLFKQCLTFADAGAVQLRCEHQVGIGEIQPQGQ